MTKEEFRNYYHGTILSDIVRSYEAKAYMASAILSFCCLDYLASRERFDNNYEPDSGKSYKRIVNKCVQLTFMSNKFRVFSE